MATVTEHESALASGLLSSEMERSYQVGRAGPARARVPAVTVTSPTKSRLHPARLKGRTVAVAAYPSSVIEIKFQVGVTERD